MTMHMAGIDLSGLAAICRCQCGRVIGTLAGCAGLCLGYFLGCGEGGQEHLDRRAIIRFGAADLSLRSNPAINSNVSGAHPTTVARTRSRGCLLRTEPPPVSPEAPE